MGITAKELALRLSGTIEGDPNVEISRVARIEKGEKGAISFLANPKYEHFLYNCKSSVILLNRDFQPSQQLDNTIIRVEDAYSAIASVLSMIQESKKSKKRANGWYYLRPVSSKIGKGTHIGRGTVISPKVKIGKNCTIYPQVFLGRGVKIGNNTTLYPGVKVYDGCEIGDNCTIHSNTVIGADGFGFAPLEDGSYKKIPQTGNVVIGNNVEIGANTCIDRAKTDSTIIRKGVKLDNLIQIGHNVEVGANTVMSAQVGIAGTSKVGANCFVAGQVGVADHVTIGNRVQIGSKSGIDKNVPDGEIRFGYPALPGLQYHRSFAVFRQLPDMAQKMRELEKRITKVEEK